MLELALKGEEEICQVKIQNVLDTVGNGNTCPWGSRRDRPPSRGEPLKIFRKSLKYVGVLESSPD